MLIVIDVGNTNMVVGAMVGTEVRYRWRISTEARTTDEMGMLMVQMLAHRQITPDQIIGVCISCVVPSLLYTVMKASRRYLNHEALVIGKGAKTGMKIRMDNPREVGADRIVNAVAAYEKHRSAVVVIDFGTATTLDCVTPDGEYIGGAIAPGFRISAEALFQRTAKLPKVELEKTKNVIASNTISAMQAGLYWGYVGLVDELAKRSKSELQERSNCKKEDVRCIATGGLAQLVGQSCTQIEDIDHYLTLRGLALLFERNRFEGS